MKLDNFICNIKIRSDDFHVYCIISFNNVMEYVIVNLLKGDKRNELNQIFRA